MKYIYKCPNKQYPTDGDNGGGVSDVESDGENDLIYSMIYGTYVSMPKRKTAKTNDGGVDLTLLS